MGKETLEEAAKRYYENNIDRSNIPREHYELEIQDLMIGFAYKWQSERLYSEEELIKIIELARDNLGFDYYQGIDWAHKKEKIIEIINKN